MNESASEVDVNAIAILIRARAEKSCPTQNGLPCPKGKDPAKCTVGTARTKRDCWNKSVFE